MKTFIMATITTTLLLLLTACAGFRSSVAVPGFFTMENEIPLTAEEKGEAVEINVSIKVTGKDSVFMRSLFERLQTRGTSTQPVQQLDEATLLKRLLEEYEQAEDKDAFQQRLIEQMQLSEAEATVLMQLLERFQSPNQPLE